jgi:8-oxo-dGTP diphosphatase
MLITVSAAAIVNAESNILLAQRPQGKSMAGLWEFPGGKVEQGESPEACLIRELKEELDITIKVESDLHPITFVSHAYTDFHLLMLLYGIRTWRGEAKGLEGQALQWADFHQLSTVPMPPADSPLLAPLKAYIEGA